MRATFFLVIDDLTRRPAPGLPLEAIGYREPDGARGVWQLGVLVLFSGLVGYYVLSQTDTRAGADFVILTICVGTVVALICALMNRVFGAQRVIALARRHGGADRVSTSSLLRGGLHDARPHDGDGGGRRALCLGGRHRRALHRLPPDVAHGGAGHLRDGAAAAADLPRARHDLHRARDADRRRRHGGARLRSSWPAIKRRLDNNPARFNFAIVRQATEATAKLSAFVLFILVGARVFSLTFYGVNGHVWVEHLLTSLPGGQVGFLVFVNIFVFLLAFFLDFFELAFIVIPLLGPAAEKLGIDLIWFGVMLGVNMQTSFMHPPFGFALFYLRSVAAKEPYIDRVTGKRMEPVTTGQIYWGAVPFVVIQCIMVALVILFPQMVMHYKSSGRRSTRPPCSRSSTT